MWDTDTDDDGATDALGDGADTAERSVEEDRRSEVVERFPDGPAVIRFEVSVIGGRRVAFYSEPMRRPEAIELAGDINANAVTSKLSILDREEQEPLIEDVVAFCERSVWHRREAA